MRGETPAVRERDRNERECTTPDQPEDRAVAVILRGWLARNPAESGEGPFSLGERFPHRGNSHHRVRIPVQLLLC